MIDFFPSVRFLSVVDTKGSGSASFSKDVGGSGEIVYTCSGTPSGRFVRLGGVFRKPAVSFIPELMKAAGISMRSRVAYIDGIASFDDDTRAYLGK